MIDLVLVSSPPLGSNTLPLLFSLKGSSVLVPPEVANSSSLTRQNVVAESCTYGAKQGARSWLLDVEDWRSLSVENNYIRACDTQPSFNMGYVSRYHRYHRYMPGSRLVLAIVGYTSSMDVQYNRYEVIPWYYQCTLYCYCSRSPCSWQFHSVGGMKFLLVMDTDE